MTKTHPIYVHKESGRLVTIVDEGQMKINDEWVNSVTYVSLDNDKMWTRSTEDFVGKFYAYNNSR